MKEKRRVKRAIKIDQTAGTGNLPDQQITVHMRGDLLVAIDKFRVENMMSTTSEAVRRLCVEGLRRQDTSP